MKHHLKLSNHNSQCPIIIVRLRSFNYWSKIVCWILFYLFSLKNIQFEYIIFLTMRLTLLTWYIFDFLYVIFYVICILIRRWMALWFCSFGIETTFPLSNFKTKHIFGILMARVKFLKPFGTAQVPQFLFSLFFLSPPKAA